MTRSLVALLLLCLALTGALACGDQRDTGDVGPVAKLRVGNPTYKEINGAKVYLYRGGDGQVLALWGISPLAGNGNNGSVKCFVVRRNKDRFRDEDAPFLDPCRGAWWSRNGRFLGYSSDTPGAWSEGPNLVQLPYRIENGRLIVDLEALRCLQNREPNCAVATS